MAVIALGLSTASALPARASTDTVYGGTVSIPSTVVSTDTCIQVPMRWALDDIPIGYNWTLEAKASNDSSTYESGDGPDRGETSIYWCDEDLTGRFTMDGVLNVTNDDYEPVGESYFSLTFNVVKMTTRASLRTTKTAVKVGQNFTLKGCVTTHRKRDEYRDIVWEKKWPGESWKRLGKGSTDTVGCYSQVAYMARTGTVSLRTKVPGDSISKTGYSKIIKVKTRQS
ncbi:hypothetical protein Kisp01_69780 [Kineosporia sp. NBRC 101677]|uniref:hypothetical protein n=1 Tax=Kineosporia sp. NBRC 101677 TaxID=3032197 RepID=UPI0024A02991|nr:hypothetical protein [Kineosporia sp. NBRC 101677]GLY19964.1 hypothetical protein Kisp01_69780 [Kineosporia sp. NBRC 101677]